MWHLHLVASFLAFILCNLHLAWGISFERVGLNILSLNVLTVAEFIKPLRPELSTQKSDLIFLYYFVNQNFLISCNVH